MHIELDDPRHCAAFIRLNEQWIAEHFAIEAADRALAADPMKIVREGGHILCLVDAGSVVVGVCALFNEGADHFQLARMAVDPERRGQGHGETLMAAAIAQARAVGARSVYLVSNTGLEPAIRLYRKHGFVTRSEGPHPAYARANIVMERQLRRSDD